MRIKHILAQTYIAFFSMLKTPCLPFSAGGVMNPDILFRTPLKPTLHQIFDMACAGSKRFNHCPEAWMYVSSTTDKTWRKLDVILLPQMMDQIVQNKLDVWSQDNHMAHPELFIKSGKRTRRTLASRVMEKVLPCQKTAIAEFIVNENDNRSFYLKIRDCR